MTPPSDPSSLPRAAAILQQGMADGIHIGAQVYVAKDGQTIADFAIGESRPGVGMTPSTLTLWLSACKPIAAIAIAQLTERRGVGLSDPVADYIPEFAVNGKEAVTLHHILTHTVGLRYVDTSWPSTTWHEVIDRICQTKLESNWPPGARARYDASNNWFLLGEIIRRVDGRPFENYVRDEIFLPLGMNDSWIGMPPEQYRSYGDRLGVLYKTDKQPITPLAPYDSEQAITHCRPASNGQGPMRELGQFYQMLLNGGEIKGGFPTPTPVLRYAEEPASSRIDPVLRSISEPGSSVTKQFMQRGSGGARLLTPQTAELFTTPRRVGMYDETFRHKIDWGLGFLICSKKYGYKALPYSFGPHASHRAFGHNGYQSSMAFADPEYGLVVAIAPNGTPGEAAHDKRLRHLLEAVYEDLGLVS